MISGDQALRIEIEDMRLMRHPTDDEEFEHKHGFIRAIMKYMEPSPAMVKEALRELDALRTEHPTKPYQRQWIASLVEVAG